LICDKDFRVIVGDVRNPADREEAGVFKIAVPCLEKQKLLRQFNVESPRRAEMCYRWNQIWFLTFLINLDKVLETHSVSSDVFIQ